MNFSYVLNQVMKTIKRPDKIDAARREINAAITFFSQDADYDEDVVEFNAILDPLQYTQTVLYSQFVRFRKFDYIKNGRCEVKELTLRDRFSCTDFRNRWYKIGSGIQVSLSPLAGSLTTAYFQYPPILAEVTAEDYWMLDGGWPFIYDRACANIFTDIGDNGSAQIHEDLAVKAALTFRNDRARK